MPVNRCPCSKTCCLFIMFIYTGKNSCPCCTLSSGRREINTLAFFTYRNKKNNKKNLKETPRFSLAFFSSSFLCPILISDTLQVINIKGNSQGKDLLELVLFPCKTYIKLWTDPAQFISRESLLNDITLFFCVWWFILQLFENRKRHSSKCGCYFIMNTS